MVKKVAGLKVNYVKFGSGIKLLMLHGWGGSLESLENLGTRLSKKGFEVLLVDLPGFGNSERPKEAFSLDDYSSIVEKLLNELNWKEVMLFGHSFGGAVAIKITLRKRLKVRKLILCNSSGIRYPEGLKIKSIKKIAKIGNKASRIPIVKNLYQPLRKFFYYYILGERDYIDHEEIAGTFRKVIKEDLQTQLGGVEVPTIIIWGEKDSSTPLEHGKIIHEKIKGARLEMIKGKGHSLPKTDPSLVEDIVLRDLK